MACSRVEDIVLQLLSPSFAPYLRYYVSQVQADPQFLLFHSNSTVLRLRVELELYSNVLGQCNNCPISAVAKCDIVEALTRAIEIRSREDNDAAA